VSTGVVHSVGAWTLGAVSDRFLPLHRNKIHLLLVRTERALWQLARLLNFLIQRVQELCLVYCWRGIAIISLLNVKSPLFALSHGEAAPLVPLKHGLFTILRWQILDDLEQTLRRREAERLRLGVLGVPTLNRSNIWIITVHGWRVLAFKIDLELREVWHLGPVGHGESRSCPVQRVAHTVRQRVVSWSSHIDIVRHRLHLSRGHHRVGCRVVRVEVLLRMQVVLLS